MSKLAQAGASSTVPFAGASSKPARTASSIEPARRTGWSVNVVGRAEHIVDHDEKERAAQLGLEPWAGDYRNEYMRLRTERVSGRRIRSDTGALTTGPWP